MQSLKRVGLATGTLTTEEINFIETVIVKTVRPQLIGRQIMPIRTLPHAGYRKYTYYTENDMSQALIDMTGEEVAMDIVDLESNPVDIPIIHKEYILHWRDILMRREGGEDLNTQHAENAALQVAEEEDKLILSGEYLGWNALGIAGLMNSVPVTSRTVATAARWGVQANVLPDVAAAKQGLRALGFYGPYRLIMQPRLYALLEILITNTDKWLFQAVGELIGGVENILVSSNLFETAGGLTDSALLVDIGPGNLELLVGQDLTNYLHKLPSMNMQGKVWEAVVPVIKRPNCLWEIFDCID